MVESSSLPEPVNFETHPDRYRHWSLEVQGDRARLTLTVQENSGLRPDYVLKLNSYDLGVDVELNDVIRRLRFEHPQVRVVTITGGLDRCFCAGANIMMLRSSPHGFKVNFCKFTNETRCQLEDASAQSGFRFLSAVNGACAGGGYELALACDRIVLVDDRSSTVSFPETPLLGVLPGTGGLTRLVDKRKVRRDLADVFSTTAEGVKGKRALEWGLVDALAPLSKFEEEVRRHEEELKAETPDKSDRLGIVLPALEPTESENTVRYRHVTLTLDPAARTARLVAEAPPDAACPADGEAARELGDAWWIFRAFREIEDALLRLRINRPDIGLILIETKGDIGTVLAADDVLARHGDHWFVHEVANFIKVVLKRLDLTAKSLFAIVGEGSCFAGTFLELALAADRIYAINDPDVDVKMAVSSLNGGSYPMANGLTRLQTRFLGTPDQTDRVLAAPSPFDVDTAERLGLTTSAPDSIDWEDELRVAIEERVSFSPDALTGMEANLRFAGPETLETKIFGRLTAWQNWIFQRPNAVGKRGALSCYGTPNRPELDYQRT